MRHRTPATRRGAVARWVRSSTWASPDCQTRCASGRFASSWPMTENATTGDDRAIQVEVRARVINRPLAISASSDRA